jgi:GTP-binding protein Era
MNVRFCILPSFGKTGRRFPAEVRRDLFRGDAWMSAWLDTPQASPENGRVNEPPPTPGFRSGYVAVAGRPNTGKSTLVNTFLGQAVAAVSKRPQTTRRRQLAILTLPSVQVVFVDTPGLHRPVHKLGEALNRKAQDVLADADVLLVVCDISLPPDEQDRAVAAAVPSASRDKALILALNKEDLVAPADLERVSLPYLALFPSAEFRSVSALRGNHRQELLEMIVARLPEGPAYFPDDAVTDVFERDLAGDLVRSAALELLHDEVPHSLAVRVEEYRERDDHSAYVAATILVERDSQKGIVIGRGGAMLKRIGTQARQSIEALTGRKVYLDLRVRLLANWRDDPNALRTLGFTPPRRGASR